VYWIYTIAWASVLFDSLPSRAEAFLYVSVTGFSGFLIFTVICQRLFDTSILDGLIAGMYFRKKWSITISKGNQLVSALYYSKKKGPISNLLL
jgi:hypothetical protein